MSEVTIKFAFDLGQLVVAPLNHNHVGGYIHNRHFAEGNTVEPERAIRYDIWHPSIEDFTVATEAVLLSLNKDRTNEK